MAKTRQGPTVELMTIGAVLLALFSVELGFRKIGNRLSGDVAHIESISDIVAALHASPSVRVLFVGNSLIGQGLDSALLSDSVPDLAVGVIHPDGTSPLEWFYLLRQHVYGELQTPDLLVIAFGPGHLFDRRGETPVSTLRLGAHHVASWDVVRLLEHDLNGFEARARFLLARLSRAFALRDRVQPRVLSALIPDYQTLAPILLRSEAVSDSVGGGWDSRSLIQVEGIVEMAAASNVPILFLAMPQAEQWTVDPRVRALTTAAGLGLLDFRSELGLPPEKFPDGEHMDTDAREAFTLYLARELSVLVAQDSIERR